MSLKYLVLLTFKVKNQKKIGHVFLGLFTWTYPIVTVVIVTVGIVIIVITTAVIVLIVTVVTVVIVTVVIVAVVTVVIMTYSNKTT